MGIKIGNEDEKSQLAIEICDISTRATTCVYHHLLTIRSSTFIDWYLILRVNENAELDAIRRQYHKFALQLHPDKNKHLKAETAFKLVSEVNENAELDAIRRQYHKFALQLHPDKNKHLKAETAFKLVSEAYFCLSNNARRAAFDTERKKNNSCIKCTRIPYPNPPKSQTGPYQEPLGGVDRVQRRMRELRNKLKDEALIIEKCLVSNARASANRNGIRTETPVFNPSAYPNKGYPHHRTINPQKLDNLRAYFMIGNRCLHSPDKSIESPVFQYSSERRSFVSRCASTRK